MGARATIAVVLGVACQRGGSIVDECRERAKSAPASAVDVCRRAFAGGDPQAGALLARALSWADAPDIDAIRTIAEQIGDRPGGADAWYQLGEALLIVRRDGDGAFAAFRRARDHREPTDVHGRTRDEYAMFERYRDRDDLQPAIEHLAEAHRLVERAGDPKLLAHVRTGMITFFLDIGDTRAAIEIVKIAEPSIPDDSPYRGILRSYQAQIERDSNNPAVAAAGYREAISYAVRDKNSALEHGCRINLVSAELELGNVAAAARELALDVLPDNATANNRASNAWAAVRVALASGHPADALALADRVLADAPPFWRSQLQTRRGEALVALGKPDDAERAFADAIALIEGQRAAVELDELKARMIADRREPFEQLFQLQARRGDVLGALGTSQAATARSFFDGLVEQTRGDATAVDRVVEAASDRLLALRDVMRALRKSSPAVAIPPEELVGRVGDRNVLSYFAAGDRVWLVAIRNRRATLHEMPLRRDELVAAISAWTRDLDDVDLARRLGSALLPVDALPRDDATIYIAPDGPLHGLPFAALVVESDRRLIERHAIAMIPSVSVLVAQDARRTTADRPAVVIGDPTGDLPGARAEAGAVATVLGVSPVVGTAATRAVVLDAARSARVLHVAAHADLDGHQPTLRLADGLLTAGEIIDAGIAPNLVILTSCASAVAPGSDDWGALASMFVAAGSSTVIGSLWSIDDDVVQRDVEALYRLDLAAPAHAVAEIQRSAIRAGRRVTTWAAYVVMGRAMAPDTGNLKPGAE